jgi:cytochrome c553
MADSQQMPNAFGAVAAHAGSDRPGTAMRRLVVALCVFGSAGLLAPLAFADGNADAGKGKTSMCIGCHEIEGYKASFPVVYSVPKIVGQSSKYIEAALQAYKKGDRSHPTMRAIAGSLSDQDIADLAAYYGTK